MMKLSLLFVVALAGVVMADDDCCAAEDRREIAYIWKKVWSSSFTDRKVTIADAVYDEVFRRFPEAKELYKEIPNAGDVSSPEWRAYLVRVASGFDTIINLLEDPDVLMQHLSNLNAMYKARTGMKKAYVEAIGDGFEKVLPQVATCFNVEAWHRCFTRLARQISKDLP